MRKFMLTVAVLLMLSPVLFAGGQRAGTSSSASSGGGYPDYLNLDGYFPIVKPGNNVSMTVSWQPHEVYSSNTDPSQMWYFRFVKEAMNIDLQVRTRAPGNEVKNLMFASGDLPDIWLGALTPNDIVNYGIGEKLILPISDYLNPTLMPNLHKVYQDAPELKSPSTASDGKVYGFSNIRGRDWLYGPITGGLARAFYNKKWLDQLNMRVPETLEEYLAVLRGYKSLGNDILPDASIYKAHNNFSLLFSALGFHWTSNNYITEVGTRNGKVTFVYGDREIYPKFVETYNTMYKEGLISQDFFTMDNNTRTAITMSGKAGTVPFNTMTLVGQTLSFDYVSAKPLTSELNKQIFWVSPANYVVINMGVIMAQCKYPEVACRLFDFNYTPENAVIINYGYPDTDKEHQYGMLKGWTIKDNVLKHQIDNPALYETDKYYELSRIRPVDNTASLMSNINSVAMRMYGLNPPKEEFNRSMSEGFMRGSTYDNLSIHAVTEFPLVVYWDEQTARRITDLSSVINDYVEIQFAQFVTGARPLSDMNKYFAELDALGYQEYLKYFVDYYAKVKSAN